MAREMGVERARQWRHDHPQVPTGDPEELAAFVSGEKSVDLLLGDSDPAIKHQTQEAANRFSALDFFGFDPSLEPPPSSLPISSDVCSRREARYSTCPRCTNKTFPTTIPSLLPSLTPPHPRS